MHYHIQRIPGACVMVLYWMIPVIFGVLPIAHANSDYSLAPVVVASPNGRFCVVLYPPCRQAKDAGAEWRPATGVAYEVGGDGGLVEVWRFKNWYSRNIRLANDGEHLALFDADDEANVYFGSRDTNGLDGDELVHLGLDIEPSIYFFARGHLIRRHSARSLVDGNSVSYVHGAWCSFLRRDMPELTSTGMGLRFRTLDGVEHNFAMVSGEEIERAHPERNAIVKRIFVARICELISRSSQATRGMAIPGPILFRAQSDSSVDLCNCDGVAYYRTDRLGGITSDIATEAPDLIIEISSGADEQDILAMRSHAYSHVNGILEYWVFDIAAKKIVVSNLAGEAKGRVVQYSGAERVESIVIPGVDISYDKIADSLAEVKVEENSSSRGNRVAPREPNGTGKEYEPY